MFENMSFEMLVVLFGGREVGCQKRSFVKTSRLKMLFVVSNVLFQKQVRYKKQESVNSMKSQV
jgi:hypothetical protein